MPYAHRKPCSTVACPEFASIGSKCAEHAALADKARGTSTQRGYGKRHRTQFREGVLARHPICQLCRTAPATDADHYPKSRRDLERMGLNPNDPRHGRGLCHRCHSTETAKHQPGGWHAAQ